MVAEGKKFDSGKPRLELIPVEALEEIAAVLSFGAIKYDPWNWAKGLQYSRLAGAALRHIFAFLRGEDKDPESGLSHLAHAACCLLFLLWMVRHRKDMDDRFHSPQPTSMEGVIPIDNSAWVKFGE